MATRRTTLGTWAPMAGLALTVAAVVGLTGCVPARTYVALGDSYAAGPGIPVQQTNLPGCAQSNHNYPHLTKPALLVLRDVSCSGAVTNDMASSQSLGTTHAPPQLNAVDADTAAISLTIGGNDIGFSEILGSCFSATNTGTPCRDTYVVNGHDQISARIAAAAPKVKAVLQGIHGRAPGAKVFVVGYLDISPDDGSNCYPQMPVTSGDAPYLRDKENELNAMLRTTADSNRAIFVDTHPASIGHDACTAASVRWVEPIAAVGAAPVHPNAKGMQAVATLLLAAMHHNGL
jgi:lysophospholipase L1-like esterase